MYNIWCELKISLLLIFLFCVSIPLYSILNNNTLTEYDAMLISFAIAYFYLIIKRIFRYFDLKKNGVILENIEYQIEKRSKYDIVLVAKYQDSNGTINKLYKRIKNIDNPQENGIVKVLINPQKPKNYYIF